MLKFRFAVLVIIVLIFSACKKTGIESAPVPPVTDTAKPVIPMDTSTLLKTSRTYIFDAGDSTIIDSSVYQWTYDNQRRIVQQSFEGLGISALFNYTYLGDRFTINSITYNNGSLVLKSDVTYFQHVSGKTDSILSSSTGYGVQAGSLSNVITYYYYNLAGQDSLEKAFDITHGTPVSFYSLNRYYTGNNLDSSIYRDGQGNLNSISWFTGGNPTASSVFANNIQTGAITFTYLDISSGGLFMESGTSRLQSTSTSVTIPATTTLLVTNIYEFDSANRVISTTYDHHGTSPVQKEVYTWY